tara:strand:- start:227 stop:493 length:267 start_codon:yes stop_codon:yes gene_type:complete
MEKIIFFGLIIPILIFIVYLGGRAIMTGFSAKSANRESSEQSSEDNLENSIDKEKNLSSELEKLNELLKSGALTQDEFEKAKKKILDN